MNRVARHVIAVGLLAGTGLLAGRASAYEQMKQCSLQTLHGQYIVAATGAAFNSNGHEVAVTNAAAYSLYYGDGTGTDYVTFFVNGASANVPSPASTTYTLNPDCTVTKTVQGQPTVNFNIYVAVDGSMLSEIRTDPGYGASDIALRARTSPFVAQ